MSWLKLTEYVNNIKEENSNAPITLLLGAGIHNLHLPNTKSAYEAMSILSSWDRMLTYLGEDSYLDLTPTLRWELLSLQCESKFEDESSRQASTKEKDQRKELQYIVNESEKALMQGDLNQNYKIGLLAGILRSSAVRDVITLNVDLIIETLVNGHGQPIPNPVNGDTLSLERHRLLNRPNADPLRIWHPHGDRSCAKSLAFGLWRYEQLLKPLQNARGRVKEREKEISYEATRRAAYIEPSNWFELMMLRPLIIIGTSLDSAEWDIWYALLSRWRNYAKPENRKYEPPIWYVTAFSDSEERRTLQGRLPPSRFQYLEAPDWDTAWKWLNECLA